MVIRAISIEPSFFVPPRNATTVHPAELQQEEDAMTLWRWLVSLFRKSLAKERDDEFYNYDEPRQRGAAAAAADNAMSARMNSGGGGP